MLNRTQHSLGPNSSFNKGDIQLSKLVDMSNPGKVLNEIKKIFCYHYPAHNFNPVKSFFVQVKKIFDGKFRGYKKCNTYF